MVQQVQSTRARRAFSLIELAVALIVVGVISAIAIPTAQASIQRARESTEVASVAGVMRNGVSIAATHDRVAPTLADTSVAFDESPLDAIVLAAGATAPEGDRAFIYAESDGVVTVTSDSTARDDSCVVGIADTRRASAVLAEPVNGECDAAAGLAVIGASEEPGSPGDPGGEPPSSSTTAPDGTDCALIPPAATSNGGFEVPAPWVPGSVSGCVPVSFVDSTMGFLDPAMVCPAFSTGSGSWVRGEGDVVLPYGFGNAVTLVSVNAGEGCVPGSEDLGWTAVPYSHCDAGANGWLVSDLTAAPYIETSSTATPASSSGSLATPVRTSNSSSSSTRCARHRVASRRRLHGSGSELRTSTLPTASGLPTWRATSPSAMNSGLT